MAAHIAWTRRAMLPGNLCKAGRCRKTASNRSGSSSAISRASRRPRRCCSSYGPPNAFSILTCWSSTIPIRSASGSVSSSLLASGCWVQTIGMTSRVSPPVIPHVSEPSDEYRPGSKEDFDRLYRTSYPRVYRTLAAILSDPEAAEDCTQDAFVQAFQAWKRWRPDAPADAAVRSDLLTALRALPPRLSAAIVLRHYHGYNNREIAAALGVSERTVGARLQRAAARLRAQLGADFSLQPVEAFPPEPD